MADRSVTVIIVSYRSADLTIQALASLEPERQRFDLQLRAIAIDNASGDAKAIEQAVNENGWQRWVEVIEAPRNGGFAYGNNRGLERSFARGASEYFYLLNPDAHILPGAVAELVGFLETHPTAGIAGSSFQNADGSEWPIAFRFPTLVSEVIHGLEFGLITRLLRRWDVPQQMGADQCAVDWISGASMMIRRQVFRAIGGMDENYFLYFEETDFCRRAQRAGFATWYVPGSRVVHIGGQITKVTERNAAPRRLPSYWFESRRRYFALSQGLGKAMLIDAVAMLAYAIGSLKRLIQRRAQRAVPHFLHDLTRSSVLWPRNRHLAPPRCYVPPN